MKDRHVFMWQSVKVSNVFNTSTGKEIFRKTKYFLKKLEYRFLVESTKNFHTKLACQKPMLRQIEWRVQNGPITKKGVLPATTLFFWKFCFSLKTWYKELIWCTNHPNVHIQIFQRRWNFIWGCFLPMNILEYVVYIWY